MSALDEINAIEKGGLSRNSVDQEYYSDNNTPGTYSLEDDDFLPGINAAGSQGSMETAGSYELSEEDGDYMIPDDEDEPKAWAGEIPETKPTPIGLLCKILSNPTEGFKSLKRSKYSVEKISMGLFYPLIILAGLSNLTALFYDVDNEGAELAVKIVFTIIPFFFGYFTTLLIGGTFLCKEARAVLHTYFGKEFIMYGVSTLALFYILFRLVPMSAPVIAFFPLWTIYVLSKGIKLFRLPNDREIPTVSILSTLIIGTPLLWDWILDKFIQ
ncbi:MAG: YIP1 family protein [Bacteroides sp.]|nr:YIP1 family protein [Bacteroides sp.]